MGVFDTELKIDVGVASDSTSEFARFCVTGADIDKQICSLCSVNAPISIIKFVKYLDASFRMDMYL